MRRSSAKLLQGIEMSMDLVSLLVVVVAAVPSGLAYDQLCMNCVGTEGMADCTFRGLTEVPQCFNSTLLYLHMHGNNISKLTGETFAIYPHIEDLEMGVNQLTSLPSDVFDPIPNITELDLSWNYITKLPNKLFSQNTKLRNINLSFNKIGRISKFTFEPLKDLKYLFLDNNQITRIDFSFYEPMTIIDFSQNKLQRIDGFVFEKFHDMDFWLDTNPWICDCKMKKVVDSLKSKNVDVPFDPKCASPSSVAGRLWSQLGGLISCS